jgi:ATP-dependent Clp protease ATP-binding subunit ClpA
MRARQIVFAARFKAGERGANAIDVEDFLLGLVLEDQGMLGENLFSTLHDGQGTPLNKAPSHVPFFPQDVAKDLVVKINALLPQMKPVGLSTEIPLSTGLEHAFDSAKTFQAQSPYRQIEPLHFLAAILKEESSQCAKLLKKFGISLEKVLKQLRGNS